jgi:hypothetical protein
MLTKSKQDRFKDIARELITKEYLGTPNIGKDIEYEDELTNAGAEYLVSIFMNTQDLCTKETLLDVMSKRDIEHKSKILPILLYPFSQP